VVSGRNPAELDAFATGLADRTGRKIVGMAADLAEPDAPNDWPSGPGPRSVGWTCW
jgi:hypothetical protein